MSKNLVLVQTTAARLMSQIDGEAVLGLLEGANEILTANKMAPSREGMITALNAVFVKAMHSDNGKNPDAITQATIAAFALAIAKDYVQAEWPDADDAWSRGGWFIGIKLIYYPDAIVTAYTTIEDFDDLEAKAAEVQARPFIENVDPRAS